MAHENINLSYPNFCLGPIPGTFCTVNQDNPTTVLRVKNSTGGLVDEYSFSSNMVNTVEGLEYVGPSNLSGFIDELTFFTLERISSSACVIKRWETRTGFKELDLKEQIIKSNSGDRRYNVKAFAVEYDYRELRDSNEYYSYVDLDDSSNIKTGTLLYIGPNDDGDAEKARVSHIGETPTGTRVYLTAPLKYIYRTGDPVTFYIYTYLISQTGYADDPKKGSLYKLDCYTWQNIETDTKAIYKKIEAARWCLNVYGIAGVLNTNTLFIRPYDSYLNWRSLFLDNYMENKVDTYNVVDILFDGDTIYRLQDAITLRDDDGQLSSYEWDTYNYQQDSLLPYNNNMNVWMTQSIVSGHYKTIDINVTVRDQYFVGLRDVEVQFYMEGDLDARFNPLSGWVTTDINGDASIEYTSGYEYNGSTEITANSDGGSASKGSTEVWNSNHVWSFPDFPAVYYKIWQVREDYVLGRSQVRQIDDWYQIYYRDNYNNIVKEDPYLLMQCLSYYTAPGGHWFKHPTNHKAVYDVKEWLPQLYRGDGTHYDAPRILAENRSTFSNWPYPSDLVDDEDRPPLFEIPNQITLVEEFESEKYMRQVTTFLIYDDKDTYPDGRDPDVIVYQPDESNDLQISQLNLSYHTHWVDGVAYDFLWTYVNINQFVFVEDAVPKFYSEKNPIDTDIWIRLRPFAFSLDAETFRMWVREDSYEGDTGYIEVTEDVELTAFDAGGGLLGLEALYDPPVDFLYNSTVYVRIEVYDEAYNANFIYVDYWFKIVPDYSSPYLTNLHPDRGEQNVAVDTNISFEIHDIGTGIDVDSLDCLLNSRLMDRDYLTVEEVSTHHIKVNYQPPQDLYFDKDYTVTVRIQDTSPNQNKTTAAWRFFTGSSDGPMFVDFSPERCKRGMGRFNDVSVKVLAGGEGLDKESIRMQVYNKDVNPDLIPIVYRIS